MGMQTYSMVRHSLSSHRHRWSHFLMVSSFWHVNAICVVAAVFSCTPRGERGLQRNKTRIRVCKERVVFTEPSFLPPFSARSKTLFRGMWPTSLLRGPGYHFSTKVVYCCDKETAGPYTLKGKHQDVLCTQSRSPVCRERPLVNSISCKKRTEIKPVEGIGNYTKRAAGIFLDCRIPQSLQHTRVHGVSYT